MCGVPAHAPTVPGGDANGYSTSMMYGEQAMEGMATVLRAKFALSFYPPTPFNVARFSLIDGRAMVMGGRTAKGQPTPAKPWLGFQNQVGHYRGNDLYQELWLQLAASGVHSFFYFAPWEPAFAASFREHQLVSDMLSEMSEVLGCADEERRWIVDANMRWQDSFLLSGSVVGRGNRSLRVWRYTPEVPSLFQPTLRNGAPSSASSAHAGPGNISIPVTMLLSGRNRSCVLGFEEAVLRMGKTSHAGWWITQPDGAPPVAVNCSGLVTVWPLPKTHA